jgi:hypothetical protein
MCDQVNNWCLSKKMSLNASKTVFMLVNKKLINCSHLSLTINGLSISPSTETVFLGLTVDCRLKWLVHVNRKIAAAKRVYFSLRAALKSTWGYDKYRLKFLYYSVVEPFLLYGCSVWAPLLSSKKNIKLLRSFQRSVTLPLSSAFKSVSTESCLALSNILPIDLRVLETTYMRYYSNSTGYFSLASSKWLTSRLPGLTTSAKYDLPMLHSHPLLPPWEPFLQPSLLVEGCELLAPNDKSVCIFVAATAVPRGSYGGCYVATSHAEITDLVNGPVPSTCAFLALQLTVLSAITMASRLLEEGLSVDIIAIDPSAFTFTRYFSKLSAIQRLCLDMLVPYRDNIRLFICQLSKSVGLQLAIAGCQLPGDSLDSLYNLPRLLPSKSSARLTIKKIAEELWDSEWRSCSNGKMTREFFPTIESVRHIPTHQLCRQIAQVLTGHSLLKEHQFRFKFANSPVCTCGSPTESVEHFIFHCPLFSKQRLPFAATCISIDGSWPRSLHSIPSNPILWEAFRQFVRSTNRLMWKEV